MRGDSTEPEDGSAALRAALWANAPLLTLALLGDAMGLPWWLRAGFAAAAAWVSVMWVTGRKREEHEDEREHDELG